MTPLRPRRVIACATYVALHVAAHLSAGWFEVAHGVSIWYPPMGLALSLLLLVGPGCAPVVFFANALGALITPGLSGWWQPWLFPALITLMLTGAAIIIRRWHGRYLLPGPTRDTVAFALVTIAAPALVALPGAGLAVLLGLTPPELFVGIAVKWWVGDASGLLTIMPVAMVFAAPWLGVGEAPARPATWRSFSAVPLAAKVLVLLATVWAALTLDPQSHYNAFYLCFLPLVWIALRHGLPGAVVATLAITMGGLVGLHLADTSMPRVVGFLFFELTVAVVGLGLGATVTRRAAAERRLVESEARLDRVLTGAQLGLWVWDLATGHVTYNDRCAEMLDVDLARLERVEPTWREFAHPDDRPRIAAALAAHLDGRAPIYEVDFRVRTREGPWRCIHSRGSVVARDTAGRPRLVSGTHLDTTDRRRAEAEARRLHQIIEVTTDLVLTTDLDGRVTHANAAFQRFLGAADDRVLCGRGLRDILPATAFELVKREAIPAALDKHAWQGETTLDDPAGNRLPVSLVVLLHQGDGEDRGSLSFVMRDLSRQKAAEAARLESERRIQQLQKAESLGVLAGGVAHDFNNLLTTMMGNANLARIELPDDAPQQELLAQIETAAGRAGELCEQMLAYAGRSSFAFERVDLTELITETRELLLVSIGRKTEVRLDLARPLPAVRAARAQMQQVVMNLVLNAAHAIGEQGGQVVIRTWSRPFAAADLSRRGFTQPPAAGAYVVLEVEDNGCGMSPETRARIFEPFFTTKFTGHGLGLAAVHGIVRSHDGAIEVVSAEGCGSTFRVFLPAQPAATAADDARPPARIDGATAGLALVIDDEAGVRRITARLLQSIGFETITVASGEEGIEQFRLCADRLTVVLLDLTMPRMDGEDVFAQIRRIRPDVPVVMMSGYSERLTPERYAANRPAGFLSKPFDRADLQAVLAGALRHQPATEA